VVHGLDIFLSHFAGYESQYVLIGGVACMMVVGDAGLEFRATKDLDIVLCCEALTDDFVEAVWSFVRIGGYQAQETSEGVPRFYRFHRPTKIAYPKMLELFSRQPERVALQADSRLTPIPVSESVPSLSAMFLSRIESEPPNLSQLGIYGVTYAEVVAMLTERYQA